MKIQKTCIISLLLASVSVALQAAPRPNILFVVCDDLSPRISPAGYPGIKTPVLDQLAKVSTTFRRAYCQYPVCGPSRASFMSGLYPETTGVLDNTVRITETRPGTPSLPEIFRKAGYWTASTGKVFHHPLENPGGEAWDEMQGFDNDETLIEKQAREAFEKEHGPITEKDNKKAWKEYYPTIAPQTRNQGVKGLGPGYGPTDLADAQHNDGKNAQTVATWLTEKPYGDKPFLIACGFHKPHIPFLAPAKYFELYPKKSLVFDLDPAADWDDIPAVAQTKQFADYGFPPLGTEDLDRRREFTQAYYACISFIDAQLGVVLNALKKSGQWDNTIIVFIGDNGYHLGEHFMWGKVHLFEESAKIPMLMRAPGITKGDIHSGLIELVDIFPTLAELCSVAPPDHLQGRSIVPMLKDATAPGNTWAYTVVKRGNTLGQAIRFEHYRYTEWGSADLNELYDLAKDPRERTNLAKNPEKKPLLKQAQTLLNEARDKALNTNK